MSIIEALWRGKISVCEACGLGNGEITELERLMKTNAQTLCDKLDQSEKALFHRYSQCAEEYTYCIAEQAFRDGFNLAAKLLCEALQQS